MDINGIDLQIKHGAASLADTGLRYVGFSGLFALGLLVTATVVMNTHTGRGLSWLQHKLMMKREDLLDGVRSKKTGQSVDPNDGLEVHQERETISSESERQADSDGKQMEERFTPTTTEEEDEAYEDHLLDGGLGMSSTEPATIGEMIKQQLVNDKIDFDGVTSEVSPMPVATDEEKSKDKECTCVDEVESYT